MYPVVFDIFFIANAAKSIIRTKIMSDIYKIFLFIIITFYLRVWRDRFAAAASNKYP